MPLTHICVYCDQCFGVFLTCILLKSCPESIGDVGTLDWIVDMETKLKMIQITTINCLITDHKLFDFIRGLFFFNQKMTYNVGTNKNDDP